MFRKDLCRPFKEKVDPIKDGAPDYLDIIHNPMDLGTIKRKIANNDYNSVQEWKDDVELVWQNAMLYNNEGSLMHIIALELNEWFIKKIASMPHSRDEEWCKEIEKVSKKFSFLSSHAPSVIINSDHNELPIEDSETPE